MNNDIIKDGENGFLAKNNDEFETKLELLIKSKKLRLKLGENGKKTVEEKLPLIVGVDMQVQFLEERIIDLETLVDKLRNNGTHQ